MFGGLSTRRYPLGLEPVGTQVAQAASGTSKSAVSRRFVAMTHTALAELLTRDLSTLDLVWLLVDGVHFAEHTCVVALGIVHRRDQAPAGAGGGVHRERHLARELLVGCASVAWRSPGRSCASSTAPRRCAARSPYVFDHPVIARGQQHKIRNVRDKLPQRLGGPSKPCLDGDLCVI